MQEPKQIKHKNKHAQAPKHPEQLLGTYGNLLNLKKHEIFDLKKIQMLFEQNIASNVTRNAGAQT